MMMPFCRDVTRRNIKDKFLYGADPIPLTLFLPPTPLKTLNGLAGHNFEARMMEFGKHVPLWDI